MDFPLYHNNRKKIEITFQHNISSKTILPMSEIILTRYLYDKTEVEVSLIHSLIYKKYEESLFWIYEYHYSGFDAYTLIWKIYYDFYASNNPKLETYIRKQENKYNDGNIEVLATIVRAFIYRKKSSLIFQMRQYCNIMLNHSSGISYKGRAPGWVKKYDIKYKNLLISISKKDYTNICYQLKRSLSDSTSLQIYELFVHYFENEHGEHFIKTCSIRKKWEQINYNNYLHRLLAFIIYMFEEIENINMQTIYILPSDKELEIIQETNTPLPLNKYNNCQNYNTLKIRRLYGIYENIGGFTLPRFEFSSNEKMIRDIWFHWEYHIRNCPLWTKRIEKHKGKMDHEKRAVEWNTDDNMEEFYTKYSYELDEIPKDIMNMSMKSIHRKNAKDYISELFPKDTLVFDFSDDFQFTY
jgi:hypothetical protein